MTGPFKPQWSTCISCHLHAVTSGWWPQQKGFSLSRGELTQVLSLSPPLLVSTEVEGAEVAPAALLFLSAPPVMEQDLTVPSSELQASLLPATGEQSPLPQCPAGQPSSSRYGCGRAAAASPVGLASRGSHW